MRENTLRNAPLDGLSITLTWSIPENPPSQGPEDFFSNYQLRFKDSQPDSSIICIVKNDGWSTGDYPYSYQLQNEREGISFDLDVDRFRIDMTKPDNYSNWDSFAPVIESGIDILLQALNKTVDGPSDDVRGGLSGSCGRCGAITSGRSDQASHRTYPIAGRYVTTQNLPGFLPAIQIR